VEIDPATFPLEPPRPAGHEHLEHWRRPTPAARGRAQPSAWCGLARQCQLSGQSGRQIL